MEPLPLCQHASLTIDSIARLAKVVCTNKNTRGSYENEGKSVLLILHSRELLTPQNPA